MYVVTIKLPRGWNGPHDPHNKVIGRCPFSDNCTDSTGEHHSIVVESPLDIVPFSEKYHITRIEMV